LRKEEKMIPVILGFVLGIIFGRKLIKNVGIGDVVSVIMTLIAGFIGAGIGIIIAIGIGVFLPSEYVLDNQIEIVALKDNRSIEGDFFLGCGSINSEFYYFFYKKEKDGSLTFDKIAANSHTKIYEEERKDGMIEIFEKRFIKESHYIFGVPFDSPKCKIHVPKGSVLRQFELDLK